MRARRVAKRAVNRAVPAEAARPGGTHEGRAPSSRSRGARAPTARSARPVAPCIGSAQTDRSRGGAEATRSTSRGSALPRRGGTLASGSSDRAQSGARGHRGPARPVGPRTAKEGFEAHSDGAVAVGEDCAAGQPVRAVDVDPVA